MSKSAYGQVLKAVALATALCAIGGCSLGDKIMSRLGLQRQLVLKSEVDEGNAPGAVLVAKRIWPTTTKPSQIFEGNFWASPVLVQFDRDRPFLVVLPSSGSIAALRLNDGKRLWTLPLPHAKHEEILLRAAPLLLGDRLMVVYTVRPLDGAISHRAAMIDLRRGAIDPQFKTLVFRAGKPAAGGGTFSFAPEWQLPRAIAHIPSATGSGRAYVTFGADRDQGGWRGWLFEVDLDAWANGATSRALSSAFSITNERECDDGSGGKLCGGGLWGYAGPLVQRSAAGDELLVQSGNGRLDLARGSYSQSLLRLTPGLNFDPKCDARMCATTNPRDPSSNCLSSCRNLFVPRLLPTDRPLRPADGACDRLSYMECLELKDWDLGASSPVRVEVDGRPFYVTGGKAGDVFLLDAENLGVMYDRVQIPELCGTVTEACPEPNAGLTMTQPVSATVDGAPIVVIPNYNPDSFHAGGVVGYRVRVTAEGPRLERAWQVPDPASDQARHWFRAPPTRPVIQFVGGEPVVWVADNAREGRLLGIRVRDGQILADVHTAGWPMRNSKPVIYDGVLYLPAAVPGHDAYTWIEAYRISARR